MVLLKRYVGVAAIVTSGLVGLGQQAAHAEVPQARTAPATTLRAIAYVRQGAVHVRQGAADSRLTADTDDTRPRWSPDGTRIAYQHAGGLWVMNADGTGRRAVTPNAGGGPAWSPDGAWLAFSAVGCTGGPTVFKVASTGGTPQALFPAQCRGTAESGARLPAATGSLVERLRADNAVAWSPDGTKIAFRGGECEAVYDDCLSVADVASGAERVVAAWGGGGQVFSGFAVVPAWRPDGQRIAFTSEQEGADASTTQPVHVVESDATGSSSHTVGVAQDRELAYASTTQAVVTGQYQGGSCLYLIDLTTGARTRLWSGSQPSVRPV